VVIVLGLTGSIGMGKSFAARAFARAGASVFDADAAVHRLIGPGGSAIAAVEKGFTGVAQGSGAARGIDRARLAARVFGRPTDLDRLEAILHPMVRAEEKSFLAAAANKTRLAVLEVPLLFETGGEARCDITAVVWAPARVQRVRVMRRAGMTLAKFAAIRSRQMSEREKFRRADFIIPTGEGPSAALREVRAIVRILKLREGRCWPGCWE
jgi:dephospho-CoA kinase